MRRRCARTANPTTKGRLAEVRLYYSLRSERVWTMQTPNLPVMTTFVEWVVQEMMDRSRARRKMELESYDVQIRTLQAARMACIAKHAEYRESLKKQVSASAKQAIIELTVVRGGASVDFARGYANGVMPSVEGEVNAALHSEVYGYLEKQVQRPREEAEDSAAKRRATSATPVVHDEAEVELASVVAPDDASDDAPAPPVAAPVAPGRTPQLLAAWFLFCHFNTGSKGRLWTALRSVEYAQKVIEFAAESYGAQGTEAAAAFLRKDMDEKLQRRGAAFNGFVESAKETKRVANKEPPMPARKDLSGHYNKTTGRVARCATDTPPTPATPCRVSYEDEVLEEGTVDNKQPGGLFDPLAPFPDGLGRTPTTGSPVFGAALDLPFSPLLEVDLGL